mmetsp:Transcript_18384/g.37212  ORF Transcript_18384/g.37212 Transcript_18384/m.37212 type:complete len:90 (-) Transcript_18384:799-1068(-)
MHAWGKTDREKVVGSLKKPPRLSYLKHTHKQNRLTQAFWLDRSPRSKTEGQAEPIQQLCGDTKHPNASPLPDISPQSSEQSKRSGKKKL